MTFKIFTTPGDDGQAWGQEHKHERRPTLEIAQDIYRKHHGSGKYFALIANLREPPIDLLVITNEGMGILELKDFSSAVTGGESGPWHYLNPDGSKSSEVTISQRYENPFDQLSRYRSWLYGKLVEFAKTKNLPAWLHAPKSFYLYGAVVCTGCDFDLSGIKISTPWYQTLFTENVAAWSETLTFGSSHRLTIGQIDLIASDLFGAVEWEDVKSHLDTIEPYGELEVYLDGQYVDYRRLNQREITLGRSRDNAITLDRAGVSRRHATIWWESKGVAIRDDGSTNGTWINGKRIEPGKGTLPKKW